MKRLARTLGVAAASALLVLASATAGGIWYLDQAGVAPRALARHLAAEQQSYSVWAAPAGLAAQALQWLDETDGVPTIQLGGLRVGARSVALAVHTPTREIAVTNADALRQAVERAMPGDVITLAPGRYRIAGAALRARRAGNARAPITLRAAELGAAVLEVDTAEGIVVDAPYWRFEQLAMRGVCADHSQCEHAFHVVGDGHHFTAVGNTISDFNAHFKINGSAGRFPDHGVIDGNTLDNSGPRRTANPVVTIDLVGASHWTIRRNLIADFIKAGGDQTSYGAFAKGAGSHNTFEGNIVWCERLLRAQPGQRVGLSLGGGGSEAAYCRDGKCITEQDDSVIAANLVASCSDDGIYLNSAARSRVLHNTVLGTAGMSARFPTSSVDFEGNLADCPLRVRDGAIVRDLDNRSTPLRYRYLGRRPDWFISSGANPLAWRFEVPRRRAGAAAPADLCGVTRPAAPTYGAFEDFSACGPVLSKD